MYEVFLARTNVFNDNYLHPGRSIEKILITHLFCFFMDLMWEKHIVSILNVLIRVLNLSFI
jgi:hypothetical protein